MRNILIADIKLNTFEPLFDANYNPETIIR